MLTTIGAIRAALEERHAAFRSMEAQAAADAREIKDTDEATFKYFIGTSTGFAEAANAIRQIIDAIPEGGDA